MNIIFEKVGVFWTAVFAYLVVYVLGAGGVISGRLLYEQKLEGNKLVSQNDHIPLSEFFYKNDIVSQFIIVLPFCCLALSIAMFFKKHRKWAFLLILFPIIFNIPIASLVYFEWNGLDINNRSSMEDAMMKQLKNF